MTAPQRRDAAALIMVLNGTCVDVDQDLREGPPSPRYG
jgi:hypothetical protein